MEKTLTRKLQDVQSKVDYPREGENISSHHYTFRIGIPVEAERVEISINGSPWQPCRPAVGYWWYDWSGYEPGSHQAAIRALTPDGREEVSEARSFSVERETNGDGEPK